MGDMGSIEENISYEYLFDLLRREKTREDLQSIDKDFYKNIFFNLNKREKIIQEKQSQTSLVTNIDFEKEKIEVKNIRKIAQDIMDRRQKKIILLGLTRARIPGTIINNDLFTEREEEFFNKCVELFRSFKHEVESSIISDCNSQDNLNVEDKSVEISKSIEEQEQKAETEKAEEPKIVPEKEVKKEKNKEEYSPPIKVEFLSEMTKFYSSTKEILGPFEKGQIAEVPEIIANILIKKGRAKKI